MKKVLVIGSTVVDVVVQIDHLPRTQEDEHVIGQKMSLGGCAYNTSDMLRHFQVPYLLFSPVGSGAYGDFVRTQLAKRGIHSPIPSPEAENGCCYCFVERGGERTFLSWHGAEYLFEKEWFSLIDPDEIDSVYICGLEIEEKTGEHIVAWLEEHPVLKLYFAPGPRITRIDPALLRRLFALHPVLHLNEAEALAYCRDCGCPDLSDKPVGAQSADSPSPFRHAPRNPAASETCDASQHISRQHLPAGRKLQDAARFLYSLTKAPVLITLGAEGCYYMADSVTQGHVPGISASQADTIGAGDSHIGAVIACLQLGLRLPEALLCANHVSAAVVETKGALLPEERFAQVLSDMQNSVLLPEGAKKLLPVIARQPC